LPGSSSHSSVIDSIDRVSHKEAKAPLSAWHTICDKTDFENFAHLKTAFGSIDKVGKLTVFDVGGNKWRLITIINYTTHKIYVRDVLTHDQYDRSFWKRE